MCVSVCVSMTACVCVYVCVSACMCTCAHVRVCVRLSVCLPVCVSVYVCVCVWHGNTDVRHESILYMYTGTGGKVMILHVHVA